MNEKRKPRRRQPGANAKRPQQKAPHAKPRKNPAPAPEPTRTAPEVVYMAPKSFSRSRLILQITTIVAVVVAVLLGLSIFFKVDKIVVSGCSQYTAWEIQQASGIEKGDQLLTVNIPKATAKITKELLYVKTVRIGISLPDTIKIEIVETPVSYTLRDQDGAWWLMDSEGKILEKCPTGKESLYAMISGVTLRSPRAGEEAVALEETTSATDPSGGTVPVTVTAAQRLAAAKSVAANLEKNSIIDGVKSIDVTDFFEIRLQYEDRFQILLGDSSRMDIKILYFSSFLNDYAADKPYEKGMLNLSNPDWMEYDPDVPEDEVED